MDLWQKQDDESSELETAQSKESKLVVGEAMSLEARTQWYMSFLQ